jgi:hypothetical protein
MKPALVFLLGLWLTAAASASRAQEFGRLFFTPEQRAALDARRKARVPDKPAAAPTVASPTSGDGRVRVPAGDGGARIGLKPGEVLDRGTGEVRDVIGDGEIKVRRGQP